MNEVSDPLLNVFCGTRVPHASPPATTTLIHFKGSRLTAPVQLEFCSVTLTRGSDSTSESADLACCFVYFIVGHPHRHVAPCHWIYHRAYVPQPWQTLHVCSSSELRPTLLPALPGGYVFGFLASSARSGPIFRSRRCNSGPRTTLGFGCLLESGLPPHHSHGRHCPLFSFATMD